MRKLVIATTALITCGSIGWAAHATSLNTMGAVSRQLGPVETIGCDRAGDCPLGYRAGEERPDGSWSCVPWRRSRYDRDDYREGPPRGWHSYEERPYGRRGCQKIGPVWYCP